MTCSLIGSTPLPSDRTCGRPIATQSVIATLILLTLLLPGCRNAPVSGRKQLVAVPEQEEVRLGNEAWQKVLAEQPATQNVHYADVVERVGRRIAAVAGRPDYEWEFRVFASDEPNAFALPGGKVAVYEGILPVCDNEAGLAVVMSHEISHVLARHGGERMTQQSIARAGGGLLGKALEQHPEGDHDKWMNAYGVASQYGVLLPYSRTHESEADSIGLMLMARAGYDPAEAPRFWERFAHMSGNKPPEFLSTHPSDAHRASHLRGLLPQAVAIYDAAPDKLGLGVAIAPRATASGTNSGIQLAGHEDASTGPQASFSGVQPAHYEQVGVEEFLPPITRIRAAPEGSTVTAEASKSDASTPPPFPDSAPKRVEPGGWTPSFE